MSEVRVVTRMPKYAKKEVLAKEKVNPVDIDERKTNYKLIAIGVSTGGPQVLQQMIPLLPKNFNVPIVIVQHIPKGFLEGMVSWLNQSSPLEINIIEQGEKVEGGKIYFCPAEYHLAINSQLRAELVEEAPGFSVRPSVSYLFRSVAKNIKEKAIGVLLTGMGKDGAEELLMMKEAGAVTIAQEEKSCVVFGMPGEAFKINAHKYILPPIDIIKKLVELQDFK
jgi:two-component system chemotaxis response regulator CheB